MQKCGHQALARTPSQGTTHHTDDLAGSLGLSCVLGASLEEMLGEGSPLATTMPATPASGARLRRGESEWLMLHRFDRRRVNRHLRQYAEGAPEWMNSRGGRH